MLLMASLQHGMWFSIQCSTACHWPISSKLLLHIAAFWNIHDVLLLMHCRHRTIQPYLAVKASSKLPRLWHMAEELAFSLTAKRPM